MKYLMLVCHDEDFAPIGDMGAATDAWVKEMDARGVRTFGERLRPSTDATTVRVRGGEVLLTDGPFAETKEQIAGLDLLECRDLDEALEVARKHPMAQAGMIEVRPFWEE